MKLPCITLTSAVAFCTLEISIHDTDSCPSSALDGKLPEGKVLCGPALLLHLLS